MPDEHINRVDPQRLQVSRAASQAVKQAASILQQELADASGRASSMQAAYASTKRVDTTEFQALSQSVRKDVHDLIALAGDLFSELQTDEVQSLVSRLAADAHGVVDTAMNLLDNTPSAAGAFARFGFTTPTPAGPAPGPAGGPTPGPVPDSDGEPPQPTP